jgi:hypothetical protein
MGILLGKGNGNVLRFLQACLSALQTLNNLFNAFTQNAQENIKFNGQKIYLQRRLNDLYDPTQRRIYIVTEQGIETKYIYDNNELQTDYVYETIEASAPFYISDINETGADYDFIIYVPVSLIYNANAFNATVSRYLAADKIYVIQTY